MTFNTRNPIGSTDARDRSDNSENLDLAVNSLSQTFVDRLGVTRDTLEGIYQKSTYYRAGTFDAGYALTNNRQTLAYGNIEYSWSGAFPKVVAAGATPSTSGGIGAGAWVDRTDVTLRSELSKAKDIFTSNLLGIPNDGVTDATTYISNMITSGYVNLSSGDYLISSTLTFDFSQIKDFNIHSNVRFIINTDIDGIIFSGIKSDINPNGMNVLVNTMGYTKTAVTFIGIPQVGNDLTNKLHKIKVGDIYAYYTPNKTNQADKSGTGFYINASNSTDAGFCFFEFNFSPKSFSNALKIACDGNSTNFISTCTFNVTSWWCDNVVCDTSLTTASKISDCEFNLKIQPDSTFSKIVKISTGTGKIVKSVFKYTLWDANTIPSRANLIDGIKSNKYETSKLETLLNTPSAIVNYVDNLAPSPFLNYGSELLKTDKTRYADNYKLEYMFLAGLGGVTDLSVAFSTIKANIDNLKILNNFSIEYYASQNSYTNAVNILLYPFYTYWGSSQFGFWRINVEIYNGNVSAITVIQEWDPSNNLAPFKYIVHYRKGQALPFFSLAEIIAPTTTTNIQLLDDKFRLFDGQSVFDTTLGRPVWKKGSNWIFQDGTIAYPV